jgi:hypothetical protein
MRFLVLVLAAGVGFTPILTPDAPPSGGDHRDPGGLVDHAPGPTGPSAPPSETPGHSGGGNIGS